MAYNLAEKVLIQDGYTMPIKELAVHYATPFGLFESLDQAIEKCQTIDMDVNLIVQPIVVIIDINGRREPILRAR